MRRSLREYIGAVAEVWWALVPGFLFGAAGVVEAVVYDDRLPVPWGPIAVASVTLAQFLAFHRVRMDRDALKRMDRHMNVSFAEKIADPLRDNHLHRVWLTVKNDGPGEAFAATGNWMDQERLPRGDWDMCWLRWAHAEIQLNEGQERELNVGQMAISRYKDGQVTYTFTPMQPSVSPRLKFYSALGPFDASRDLRLRITVLGRQSDQLKSTEVLIGLGADGVPYARLQQQVESSA